MQPIDSVCALNNLVALDRGDVRQFVHNVANDPRTQTHVRLRNSMLQSSYQLVRQAHSTVGPVLSQGLGTGRAQSATERPRGHVFNPGANPAFDSSQAVLQGGLCSTLVAVVCMPWLPAVGISPMAAIVGLCAGGASIALVLHHTRTQGHHLPLLEDIAGALTAFGRASLTLYAGALGAMWGLATFLIGEMQPRNNTTRP